MNKVSYCATYVLLSQTLLPTVQCFSSGKFVFYQDSFPQHTVCSYFDIRPMPTNNSQSSIATCLQYGGIF